MCFVVAVHIGCHLSLPGHLDEVGLRKVPLMDVEIEVRLVKEPGPSQCN